MTNNQKRYCIQLRVSAILLTLAVGGMALAGGYGEDPQMQLIDHAHNVGTTP